VSPVPGPSARTRTVPASTKLCCPPRWGPAGYLQRDTVSGLSGHGHISCVRIEYRSSPWRILRRAIDRIAIPPAATTVSLSAAPQERAAQPSEGRVYSDRRKIGEHSMMVPQFRARDEKDTRCRTRPQVPPLRRRQSMVMTSLASLDPVRDRIVRVCPTQSPVAVPRYMPCRIDFEPS